MDDDHAEAATGGGDWVEVVEGNGVLILAV